MLITPKPPTLKKYGLTEAAWRVMADRQKHACAICRQEPTRGRLCIDHDHVKGFKKLPFEQKAQYCRGLLCFRCNTTFCGRGITIQRSQWVTEYLQNYEAKKAK